MKVGVNMIRGYLYIFLTISFMVYGHLVIKWQMLRTGSLPEAFFQKVTFLFCLLFNAWVISSLLATFLAALCWMAVMSKFDLSYAYPFMGLTFVLVLLFSGLFFHEPITTYKLAGIAFIITGIFIGSQG
jgi:multidrug transporter EmrE-like cation transporter